MTAKKANKPASPPFQTVLDQHGPGLHTWLTARVGPDRADDVFQETMLSALRAWEGTEIDSARAWLFAIARNKAIDEDRRQSRQPVPDGEPEAWPSAESVKLLDDPIWDEVRGLPEKQRAAVTLRYRADLTHREISEVMGISEAAARRNVFEGLKTLRERFGDE